MKKEWFADWFDSPYYHLLYKNHDESDARRAIDNLLRAIELPPHSTILDLACGKGRHSKYLAERGFEVTGLDISEASIVFARQFENERLTFFQHDMRLPFRINFFDAVVNFFTSFGYFENENEHLLALKNVSKNLRPGGVFVLDFFNSVKIRKILVRQATKTVEGITFKIRKTLRGGHVFKTVEFETGGRKFYFREKVRLFELADFQSLFSAAGLEIVQVFGGYDLQKFDPASSDRLILIAKKI